jgi:hypothetical protein
MSAFLISFFDIAAKIIKTKRLGWHSVKEKKAQKRLDVIL